MWINFNLGSADTLSFSSSKNQDTRVKPTIGPKHRTVIERVIQLIAVRLNTASEIATPFIAVTAASCIIKNASQTN